jgi:hypothetical protein
MDNMKNSTPRFFKRCPMCGKVWMTKELFLRDTSLRVNGYQCNRHINTKMTRKIVSLLFPINISNIQVDTNSAYSSRGYLIYTHQTPQCGTSIAVDPKSLKGCVN